MCGWSETDLSRVAALANLPSTPPADDSNAYATNPDAIALGKMFYFDTRFSGPSNWLDGLNRVMPFGRTAIGQSAGVACVSCHDHGHGGADPASTPGDVSVGAGWTYNNSLTTFNSAFYLLHLWNGRADSLWAQAVADNENPLTTNGNRLHTAWLIYDLYGPTYRDVFADYPLPTPSPFDGPSSAVQAMVDATGQCVLVDGACPDGLPRGHLDGGGRRPRLLAPFSAAGEAREDGRLSVGPGQRAVRRCLGLHGPGRSDDRHAHAGQLRQGDRRLRRDADPRSRRSSTRGPPISRPGTATPRR